MKKQTKKRHPSLDYHEGLSWNQCQIILTELGLDCNKFSKWMYGQTCPEVPRFDSMGNVHRVSGIFEYDVFRWVRNQKKGETLIFD